MTMEVEDGSGRRTREQAVADLRSAGKGSQRLAKGRLTVLRFYYWATPLFFLADTVWGVSVRATFLPRADMRLVYYAFCLACAFTCHWRPDLTPFVGMGESAVNLLLIALGVMLPIWGASDALLSGAEIPAFMTPAKLVNVMLSGSILILAFHRSQSRLLERYGPGRRSWR